MIVTKLIGLLPLVAAGKSAYDKVIIYKLISRAALITGLAVISAMLSASLLVGIVYFTYYVQVQNGIDPLTAMAQTGGGLALLVAALIAITVARVKGLIRDIKSAARANTPVSPIVDKVSDVANGFMDGLLHRDESDSKAKAASKWRVVK